MPDPICLLFQFSISSVLVANMDLRIFHHRLSSNPAAVQGVYTEEAKVSSY